MLKRTLRWLLILVIALIVAVYFLEDQPGDRPTPPAVVPTVPASATASGTGPRTLSAETFDAGVASGVHLVDFWAEWCGPCHAIAPTVEKISADYAGRATVSKLEVDAYPELAERFEITALPTLIVFKDGEIAARILGVVPEEMLAEALDAALR